MTLIESRPLAADLAPAATSGSTWVLEVSRRLRGCESVEAVMAAAPDLAADVTGCREAGLIGVKPNELSKAFRSPQAQIAQACVGSGAAVWSATAEAAAAAVCSSGWHQVLGELTRVASDPSEDLGLVLAFFAPNGAGRHAAALLLHFDATTEPPAGLIGVCQAFVELVDKAAAHQHAQEQVASLLAALQTSREIGTAIGILMASRHIGDDEAFALLREVSQRTHRKINAIAAEVVYTGMLPG